MSILFLVSLLSGCGTASERSSSTSWVPVPTLAPTPVPVIPAPKVNVNPVVAAAQALVGTPYQWGGESPAEGFDCSGLVQYAYGQAGLSLPRTAREQYHRMTEIAARELAPGDLVFFKPPETRAMHVGIYIGNERFLHAPSHGKRVGYARLNNPYWHACFIGGRRGRLTRGPL
jgi:cell wall-associated NlpC family hydrolase